MEVKILSWNIRHGLGLDGRHDLQRVLAVIKETDPDIAILNEVDRHLPRSGFIDQARWLARKLSMNHFFSPSLGLWPIGFGNAILSKGTLLQPRFLRLSLSRALIHFKDPRKALLAEIGLRGRTVTCIGVHLNVVRAVREVECAKLLGLVRSIRGTTLLAGDFNFTSDTDCIEALSGTLTDVFAGNPIPTFPAQNPRKRIDYLFISSDCNIINNKVLLVEGSDHLPLFAVITI